MDHPAQAVLSRASASPQRLAFPLILAALLGAGAVRAAPAEDAVAVVRAAALARAGQCRQALAALAHVEVSGEVALLRGQCHLQLHQYPLAVEWLERARSLDPDLPDVDLQLAMARFHQGDLVGAREALDAAAPRSGDRAEYHLYRGLLLLQSAESARDAVELERARHRAAGRVEPTASYYAGLAWAAAEDAEKARAALDRVIAEAPDSPWAEQARRAEERLAAARKRSWWAWVRGGLEHDNNVVLRGDGVTLPGDISHTSDGRGVFEVGGGAELLRNRDWAAGVTGSYRGDAQFDLQDFNQHYPVLGFWVDRRLDEPTSVRLRYDAGYAWVDQSPFVFGQNLGSELFHDWGARGHSKLFATVYRLDYFFSRGDNLPDGTGVPGAACPGGDFLCGPPGLNQRRERNRDGWGVSTGIEHTLPIPVLNAELSGGYRFHHYDSRGREYRSNGHELWLGNELSLPLGFSLNTLFSFTYAPYDHPSSFADPEDVQAVIAAGGGELPLRGRNRRDKIYLVHVEIEKSLTEHLSISAAYFWRNNVSNVAVFDYDRRIVGGYVTYRFGG